MTILTPTRRDILAMAAAAPALTLPAMARAELGAPATGNPSHFAFTLGEARLTVISDGSLQLPANGLGVNADPAEVRSFLERHCRCGTRRLWDRAERACLLKRSARGIRPAAGRARPAKRS